MNKSILEVMYPVTVNVKVNEAKEVDEVTYLVAVSIVNYLVDHPIPYFIDEYVPLTISFTPSYTLNVPLQGRNPILDTITGWVETRLRGIKLKSVTYDKRRGLLLVEVLPTDNAINSIYELQSNVLNQLSPSIKAGYIASGKVDYALSEEQYNILHNFMVDAPESEQGCNKGQLAYYARILYVDGVRVKTVQLKKGFLGVSYE